MGRAQGTKTTSWCPRSCCARPSRGSLLKLISLPWLSIRRRSPSARLTATPAHARNETTGPASTRHQPRCALAYEKEVGKIKVSARCSIAKQTFRSRIEIRCHIRITRTVGCSSYGYVCYLFSWRGQRGAGIIESGRAIRKVHFGSLVLKTSVQERSRANCCARYT